MHAMMDPDQILEHARAAEAAGRAPLLHGHPGPGALEARLREDRRGRPARRRAHEPQALRLDRAHVRRARARRSRRPASSACTTTSRRPRATTPRSRPRSATRAACARSTRSREAGLETCVGGILNLGESREQRVEMAFQLAAAQPHHRADQPAQPAARHQVRRPRADGPLGGRQVGRDLPADHPRRALPPLRRPQREPRRRRAPAARGEGRAQRGDDGQLPHHARLRAGGGPRDVRGARPERGAPGRQRRQPAARQPLGLARRRDAPHARRRADRLAGGGELLEPSHAAPAPEEDLGAAAAGRRAERVPRGGPRGARTGGAPHEHDIEERLDEIRDRGLYRRMRCVSGPQGPRVLLDGKPGAAALLEQLPRPGRPPARARGGRRGGDALRRGLRRVAPGLGQHDDPPPARGAARRASRAPRPACCSARATWRTPASCRRSRARATSSSPTRSTTPASSTAAGSRARRRSSTTTATPTTSSGACARRRAAAR